VIATVAAIADVMRKVNRMTKPKLNARMLAAIAILAAIGALLSAPMFVFKIPIMPSFISFDFSLIPIAIAALILPYHGAIFVALVKAILHFPYSSSMGIGTLQDFVTAVALITGVWLLFKVIKKRTLLTSIFALVCGALLAGLVSIPFNMFVSYPLYTIAFEKYTMEAILSMYQKINKNATNLPYALAVFNLPFTIARCLINSIIAGIIGNRLRKVVNKT